MESILEMKAQDKFKFGDKILNHWAGENNPRRIGIFIRYCRVQRKSAIECTDMNGDVWQHEANDEKLEKIGSILNTISLTEQIEKAESEKVKYSQTPLKYFESRNGGKSAESMMNDGEMITPIYAVQLISEYILDCGLFVEPQAEQPEENRDVYLILRDGNTTRLYKNGIKVSPEKFLPFYGFEMTDEQKSLLKIIQSQYLDSIQSPSGQPSVTDEEISQVADDEKQQDWDSLTDMETWADGFRYGAKWMRSKIYKK